KGDKGDIGNSLGTYYGTTSTAAGTVTKTVACPEMAAYVKGHRLTVLFTPAHTATSMSLNVNGLGALGVYYKNSNTIPTGLITANSIHDFTYDGTRFRYVASGGACPFPVNSIYLSMSSSNPNAYWPGTTWSQVSQGRMLVGVSSQDIDFNAANKTGGTKTHHHKYNIAGREWYGALVGDIGNGLFAYDYPNSAWKSATSVGSSTINRNSALVAGMTQTLTTATATGDVGTSIESGLPPYLSVYIWQRTV
ncbi:MAG: hypothetical protein LBU61_00890, partial [Coriobacteriales bacterium]|nr:hypothetical protein [Coriobacteriales bacterium]